MSDAGSISVDYESLCLKFKFKKRESFFTRNHHRYFSKHESLFTIKKHKTVVISKDELFPL